MRHLLVTRWYHFAFLVISVAVLGFAASGTLLAVLRTHMLRRQAEAGFVLALLCGASIVACWRTAETLPVSVRLVGIEPVRQIAWWTLYWLLLLVPFLLGASVIGLMLTTAGNRTGRVYAGNLIGSGAGAAVTTGLFHLLPSERVELPLAVLGLVGAAALLPARRPVRWLAVWIVATAAAGWCLAVPPQLRVDEYKYLAYAERLVEQGTARRVATLHSPRGRIDVFEGAVFHDIPFLAVGTAPPSMYSLVIDGNHAGSILRIHTTDAAAFLENTLMAWPYALAPPRPKVLLLGETGGVNVWLARRMGARHITVVQPHAGVVRLLRGPLREEAGGVFDGSDVRVVVGDPRAFLDGTDERFDLIQIVSLESLAAGGAGIAGLAQDYVATVEGLMRCLRCLTEEGLVSVSRGLQTPPRDNVKVFATFVEALERADVGRPGDHLAQVRDYIAACTVASRNALTDEQVAIIRQSCRTRPLTPTFFPSVESEELNTPDRQPGPEYHRGCWYHYAACETLWGDRRAFFANWAFDVRPATDDRPYFHDFFKLASLPQIRRAFGPLWLTHVELGFLFVLTAIVMTTIIGGLLALLPLVWLPRDRSFAAEQGAAAAAISLQAILSQHRTASPRYVAVAARAPEGSAWGARAATFGYFTCIGLGYMFLEIAFIGRLTRFIGDPTLAASACLVGFLVFSGLGSAWAGRVGQRSARSVATAMFALLLIAAAESAIMGDLFAAMANVSAGRRYAIGLAIVAAPAVLMGWPMPTALSRLGRRQLALVPWAWAVNGFASAVAAPLAIALSMVAGQSWVVVAAVACYALAAVTFPRLPAVPREPAT